MSHLIKITELIVLIIDYNAYDAIMDDKPFYYQKCISSKGSCVMNGKLHAIWEFV
jgi:hypothetical protein